ncbi:hypothetical protein I350_04213 [Cryptococcus amylolentus CBS 6273]|uniref:Uncharacterized protein n=1 Tax=Cryptococcus amylolentus CBS 6273 TaxID=1296118 RepID=A0A1E3K1E9_9TREE|nr:hypothetical protein I350_04213 [Cryptococcus amylolentus CBS 6273]
MPPQRPSAPRTPASKHSRELKPARRVVWIRNPLDILADAVDILDRTSPPRVEGRGIPCDVPAERRRPRYHDLPFTPPSSTHATQRPRIVASDTTSRLSKRLHHTTLAPLSPVAAHLQPTRLLRSPEIHKFGSRRSEGIRRETLVQSTPPLHINERALSLSTPLFS